MTDLLRYDVGRDTGGQPFWSACYAPFVGMSFDPNGLVSVCGFTRATPLGRVGVDRLADLWDGPIAAEIRHAVRSGELHRYCSRCAEEIAGGNLHGVLARGFDPFTAQESAPWPLRMEFALTNACNLQCIMCSGEFSSAIRSQREGLPPLRSRYDDRFIDELTPFLPHLRQARFLGGEPFLSEMNFRIWERMVELGVTAECNVTTNGTQWTPRMEAVLDRLPFSVGISVDGVTRETVEHIRSGASHERIMENLARFVRYRDRRGTSLSLTFCLMVQNVHEYADYLHMAEDLGCQVYVNTVRQPPEHSLYRLPDHELQAIVSLLEARREEVSARLELNRAVWNEQIDRLHGHLRARRAGASGTAVAVDPDQTRLVEALGDPAASEGEVIELLRTASVDGEVSVVRCDAEDDIAHGGHYVGMDIGHLVGEPVATLFPMAAARFGHRVDVLAQRVAHGAAARLVVYDEDGGEPTVLAMVTRRGPDPYATTKVAAVVVRGRRAADPVTTMVRLTTRS